MENDIQGGERGYKNIRFRIFRNKFYLKFSFKNLKISSDLYSLHLLTPHGELRSDLLLPQGSLSLHLLLPRVSLSSDLLTIRGNSVWTYFSPMVLDIHITSRNEIKVRYNRIWEKLICWHFFWEVIFFLRGSITHFARIF